MDRFAALDAFTHIVETGSFTAAAQALGLTRAAVSRQVRVLEDRLGSRLLNRTTRRVSLTEAGHAYYETARRVLGDLAEAEAGIAQLTDAARGLLRIDAPMSFGTLHLAPAIAEFMARYPDVVVQLALNDRFVDIVEEGFDIGLRIGRLEDSSLIARRVVESRRVLCAAPDYLTVHGRPEVPRDLRHHRILHYGYLESGATWRLSGKDGDHSVQIQAALCANNGEVLRDAAVAGQGIALLPTFIAGGALQTGSLVTVLSDYRPPEAALYALYPPNRYLAAKVRLFIDFLVERFGGRPHWDLVE